MFDVGINGIPNYGFAGAGGGLGPFGGVPNQSPAWSANDINSSIWGGYSPGAAQGTLNNIYGAGGFGGQTDYYSNLGAAYGRQTGGFGGYGGGDDGDAAPAPQVDEFGWSWGDDGQRHYIGTSGAAGSYGAPSSGSLGSSDMFGGYQPQPAAPAYNPFAQYASGGYNPFSAQSYAPAPSFSGWGGGAAAIPAAPSGGYNNPALLGGGDPFYGAPAGSRGGIGSDALRDQFSWMLAQSSPYATPQSAPQTSGMPNLGYNPGMQNWFAPQSGANSYPSLYGAMQFPNSGTPSQYAPGGAMPPGFSGTYGADNPGGALPLGQYGGYQGGG